jgi:hypothetical protein
MSWYLLLVACSITVQAALVVGAFVRGFAEGDSTEATRPTHGGITIAAYRLGRWAHRRRDALIRDGLKKGLR